MSLGKNMLAVYSPGEAKARPHNGMPYYRGRPTRATVLAAVPLLSTQSNGLITVRLRLEIAAKRKHIELVSAESCLSDPSLPSDFVPTPQPSFPSRMPPTTSPATIERLRHKNVDPP